MRILALVALVFVGCQDQVKFPTAKGPIILITVDTLRSDHLPIYGYRDIHTPGFEQLAEVSHVYESAFSSAPMTLPAHASILSGLDVPNHGVLDNAGYTLKSAHESIVEIARQSGYRTGGFVSSAVLRENTGVSRGFETYDDHFSEDNSNLTQYASRPGEETMRRAKSWMEEQEDGQFLVWIHLFEPHTPYSPPEWTTQQTSLPYDGEILEIDRILGELWHFLKQKSWFDPSTLILTSDHGEGLGDHGEAEHGLLTYRETIQVPLMIKTPFQKQAKRFSETVSVTDIAPTISAMMGHKNKPFDGQVILPKPTSGRMIRAQAYAPALHFGWHIHQSVIQDDWHLVMAGEPEAYQWSEDPLERQQQRLPKSKRKMFGSLVPETFSQPEKLTEEERQLLASLGYSGHFSPDESVKALSREAFLQLHSQINQCIQWFDQRSYEKVIETLAPVVSQYSQLLDARLFLAKSLRLTGNLDKARFVVDGGLKISPENPPLLLELTLLNINEDPGDLLASAILHGNRDPVSSWKHVVPLLLRAGKTAVLSEMAKNVHDAYLSHWIFAQLAYREQDYEKAHYFFIRAAEIDAGYSNTPLLYYLGDVLVRLGALDSGLLMWEKGLALDPSHLAMRRNYCFALASGGRFSDIAPFLESWLAQSNDPSHLRFAVSICEQLGLSRLARKLAGIGSH